MSEVKWEKLPQGNPQQVGQLSSELGIDPVLATLLVQRGITRFDQAREFFRPSLSALHDPFLMKDMGKAVARMEKALSQGEKILIYGDYDVDGTTAVSLVCSFFRRYTDSIDYYIPDRYDEGSGVSRKGIDWAAENGFTLIVTLDCGIKAEDKVRYAASKGIDVIICDHHLPDESMPQAVAVLDPKCPDCGYPYDDLSGCGVGFKLVQAYAQTHGVPFEEIQGYLDLLVVSIASDLVNVTGENRILAHFGLKQINESPRKGLLAVINLAGVDPHHITIDDIVFKIGPRINAAGRMESGRIAVQLLTAETDKEAFDIGQEINRYNIDRKAADRTVTEEAKALVEKFQGTPETYVQMEAAISSGDGLCLASHSATIVYNPRWHKGVVGIVASRLVEAYYRPTIVFTRSNGFVTGSARSVQGFDLYGAIDSCNDLLENFGGHLYAVGLTMKEENLPVFCKRMEAFIATHTSRDTLTPVVDIDADLSFSGITPKFFRILKQFQPFGPGNPLPVFRTENVYDNGNGRRVGAEGGHLKLELVEETRPYNPIAAIAFNKSEYYPYIKEGNPIDVCYSIVENYYRGIANLQLRIKDIKPREEEI
ncbi:MAG: single-stranded-DNA-specific exonuclease RecJ [Bacteroidales bacterium]|nr:single-stranded-DNA-specific exonuclease RecJ [Bacteroidales bacterium]